jgi:hypothetical protein
MGIYTPAWQRVSSPKLKGVGHFEAEVFDPETWTPNYWTAPQKNRLPDDLYWAAKKVMALLAVEAYPEGLTLLPDRPSREEIAKVQDAAIEFLSDWLVRQKVDEAMGFISDQALECFRINQAEQGNVIEPAHARTSLATIMKAATQHLGKHQTLSPSIEAVIPWRQQLKVVDHPYAKDFSVVEVPDDFAGSFLCQCPTRLSREELVKTLDKSEAQYRRYYATLFRIRRSQNQGAVLAVLWAKENGAWRILSYDVLRP